MKILNFGSCNIDYVYHLSEFVRPGETVSATDFNRFPGGKGLNQSIAVSRSGVEVIHAGCIGEDGLFLKDVLNKANVNTSLLRTSDIATGHAIIQVTDTGENSIILYGGANKEIGFDYIDEVLSEFSEGDLLMLQNEINNIEYIVDKAFHKGMKIMLNPSPFDEKLKALDMKKITYLILNEIEAYEFSGKEKSEDICEFFRANYPELKVMLTLGSKGCVYFDNTKIVRGNIFPVKAVDTTSAGDTFTGYFVYGLVNGMDMKEVLRFASAASAIAVSRQGASVSIPTRNEVENFLKEN